MSSAESKDKVWLTTEQVCKHLKISPKALLQRCYRGSIPYYKSGRQNRYLKAEIDNIIEATKRQQTSITEIKEWLWQLNR